MGGKNKEEIRRVRMKKNNMKWAEFIREERFELNAYLLYLFGQSKRVNQKQ